MSHGTIWIPMRPKPAGSSCDVNAATADRAYCAASAVFAAIFGSRRRGGVALARLRFRRRRCFRLASCRRGAMMARAAMMLLVGMPSVRGRRTRCALGRRRGGRARRRRGCTGATRGALAARGLRHTGGVCACARLLCERRCTEQGEGRRHRRRAKRPAHDTNLHRITSFKIKRPCVTLLTPWLGHAHPSRNRRASPSGRNGHATASINAASRASVPLAPVPRASPRYPKRFG